MEQMSLNFNILNEMHYTDGCFTCKHDLNCDYDANTESGSWKCLNKVYNYSIRRGKHLFYYNQWEPK